MAVKTADGILMIEPTALLAEPLIDALARKMTAAWRRRRDDPDGYRGFHICACGACSDNKDHWVGPGTGRLTNSLCVHYLVFHRPDVPKEELEKVAALADGEEEPTEDELAPPPRRR